MINFYLENKFAQSLPIKNLMIRGKIVQREVFILALVKSGERFVFVYDIDSTDLLLEELQNQACSSDSPLNGFDAAILAGKMREQVAGQGRVNRVVSQ